MKIDREIVDYLEGPARLREAVRDMTAQQLDATPIPNQWSTRQVVCHITDFELVYADRMKRVIAEEEPTMFGGDPDQFAARLAYETRDVAEELALIETCRRHVARILRSLPVETFQRRGMHSEAGPLTLQNLLTNITNHIPHHIEFIQAKRKVLGC